MAELATGQQQKQQQQPSGQPETVERVNFTSLAAFFIR